MNEMLSPVRTDHERNAESMSRAEPCDCPTARFIRGWTVYGFAVGFLLLALLQRGAGRVDATAHGLGTAYGVGGFFLLLLWWTANMHERLMGPQRFRMPRFWAGMTAGLLFLVFIFATLFSLGTRGSESAEARPPSEPALGDAGWSGWIQVPDGFRRYEHEFGTRAAWDARHVTLVEGRYIATVGAYRLLAQDDGKPDYYSIDIETPIQGGFRVVGSLSFPLGYVSEDRLEAPADRIVAFDVDTRVVTYDLGKSIFKFQLPEE